MKTFVLFDIDGTLLLTGGAGRIAFEKAFDDVFQTPGQWGEIFAHGKTDPIITQEIAVNTLGRELSVNELERISGRYVTHFEREIDRAEKFRVLEGAVSLVEQLSQRENLALGLQTGNYQETAWLKVKRAGLDMHFLTGGFASDSSERRQIVKTAVERLSHETGSNPQRVVLIGDAPQDIDAGKSLGATVIAVATGRHSVQELDEHEPSHLLEDLSDTTKVVNLVLSL